MINAQDFSHTRQFPKGGVIIKENVSDDGEMYIVLCGMAEVYKNYGEVGEIKLGEIAEDEFFGEMSLFLGAARTATVVAATDMTVIALNRESALEFFETQPDSTYSLIQSLCARIQNTSANIADSSVKFQSKLVTLSKEKEQFKTEANTDALTGAFNRRYFMEAARLLSGRCTLSGKSAYIAMLDLDYFKKVNDTYGHQAGDKTLKTVASIVMATLRKEDLFARYGGEEFVMLIPAEKEEDAMKMAERIRDNIENMTIKFEENRIKLTASIGAAKIASADDIETAVKRADENLYRAKQEGRNRVVFG